MTDQQHDETPAERDAADGVVAVPDPGRNALTGASVNARIRYATLLADSSLVPKDYRGKPANAFLAVETGTMLGVHPIAALNGIHVIEGKPTISPGLMTALVRRAGHKVRTALEGALETGDLAAEATVIRHDDPEWTYRARWTLQRAERAGLCRLSTENGRTKITARDSQGRALPWEKYPEAMLKARAIGEVCREAAEDALSGVHYTPEELGAVVGEDGDVIDGEVVDTPPQQQTRPQPAALELEPSVADPIRDEVVVATTTEELGKLWAKIGPDAGNRSAATTVGDENGAAISLRDLFTRAGEAVKAGQAPLLRALPADDDVVDAEVVEEPERPAGAREQLAERGPLPADDDPWATGPQDVQLDDPAAGDYVPGVPTAEAILGGEVIDRRDLTAEEIERDRRHREAEEDRLERLREHSPEPGRPVDANAPGRQAMAAARERVRQNAAQAAQNLAARRPY